MKARKRSRVVGWSLVLGLVGISIASLALAQDQESGEIPVEALPEGAEAKQIFATVCATCHGLEGEGNPEIKAPSIAGMPAWFVGLQLEKFREDIRGAHPEDLEGAQMRAIAKSLKPEWIESMANHVAEMKPKTTENTLGGDPDFARDVYEQHCMECHRYNGQGERVFRSAPLTSLSDWYVASTLRKFRKGVRGGDDALDYDAWKMHERTKTLSDDLIVDMAAYIAELAETYPPGVRKGRVRRPERPRVEVPQTENPFENSESPFK